MSAVRFFLIQVLLLGSAAWLVFAGLAWWHFGFFWASDEFSVWMTSLVLVALFLLLVAGPLQLACRRFGATKVSPVIGAISGPLAVMLYLYFVTHRYRSFDAFFTDMAEIHMIFAVVGLVFSIAFQRWLATQARVATDGA